MKSPTNHPTSVLHLSGTDDGPLRGQRRGWWGIAFVVINLICQGAVALPETNHTTSFISAYYSAHRAAITLTQLCELLITVFLWRWVLALGMMDWWGFAEIEMVVRRWCRGRHSRVCRSGSL